MAAPGTTTLDAEAGSPAEEDNGDSLCGGMFRWLCLRRSSKNKANVSFGSGKGKKEKAGFDNIIFEDPKPSVKPGFPGRMSSAAEESSKQKEPPAAALAAKPTPAAAPPAAAAPPPAASAPPAASSSAASAEEEAAQLKAVQNMQKHYRGKLGRLSAEAQREREVIHSTQVKVTMNEEEEITHINDYKMDKILGQGAYGIVYKANGPAHGEVAVKVLNRSATGAKHAVSGLSGATAPHRFAWCLPGATPLLLTRERRLSSSEAGRGPSSPAQAAPQR